MTDMIVPPRLAERLHRIAEHEGRPAEDVLESLIEQYPVPEETPDADASAEDIPPPGTLARLAYEAERASFASGDPDLVDKSREILRTEFPDYLKKRMNDDHQ